MRITLSTQLGALVLFLASLITVAVTAGRQGLADVDQVLHRLRNEAWEATLAQAQARGAVQDQLLLVETLISQGEDSSPEVSNRDRQLADLLEDIRGTDLLAQERADTLEKTVVAFQEARQALLLSAREFRTLDAEAAAHLDDFQELLIQVGSRAADALSEEGTGENEGSEDEDDMFGDGLGQLSSLGNRLAVHSSAQAHVALLSRFYLYRQLTALTELEGAEAEKLREQLEERKGSLSRHVRTLVSLDPLAALIEAGPTKGRTYKDEVAERLTAHLAMFQNTIEAHAAKVLARAYYTEKAATLAESLAATEAVARSALTSSEQELSVIQQKASWRLQVVLVAGLLLTALAILYIMVYISRPLRLAAAAITAFAAGELTEQVYSDIRSDEVGDLHRALQVMVEQVEAREESLRGVAAEHTVAIQQTATTLAELRASMQEIRNQAQTLANRAETSVSAGEAGVLSNEAAGHAILGLGTRIDEMGRTVQGLVDSLGQVDVVLGAVSDIAEQAKFLALNAAIEAARSGEAGRGFGVVATEVRNLAVQSQAATAEVRDLIQELRGTTRAALDASAVGRQEAAAGQEVVKKADEAIQQLVDAVRSAGSATDQILGSVKEQSEGLDSVADAVGSIHQSVAQTLDTAQS